MSSTTLTVIRPAGRPAGRPILTFRVVRTTIISPVASKAFRAQFAVTDEEMMHTKASEQQPAAAAPQNLSAVETDLEPGREQPP